MKLHFLHFQENLYHTKNSVQTTVSLSKPRQREDNIDYSETYSNCNKTCVKYETESFTTTEEFCLMGYLFRYAILWAATYAQYI